MNPETPGDPTMERNDGASSHLVLRVIVAVVIFGATLFVVMLAAGALCYSLPRQYFSKVTMEVKADDDMSFASRNNIRNPNLQPTQFQIIQSKEILYPVIDNLKLVETWSMPKEEAYNALRTRLQLSSIRNTDLIQIGVFSPDRVESANIANMIAVVYQKVRRDDQMRLIDAALGQLKEEIASQRKNVEALQTKMEEIRLKEGISDANPEELSGAVNVNAEAPIRYLPAKADYLKSKKNLEEAEKRLSTQSVQLKSTVNIAKIWEKAEPAMYPSQPNVLAIMSLAAVVGVFFGLVLAGIYLFCTRRQRTSSLPN